MIFSNESTLFSQAEAVRRSVVYMNNELPGNTDCYSTVVAAYALTLVEPDSSQSLSATEKLRSCSVFNAGTSNYS